MTLAGHPVEKLVAVIAVIAVVAGVGGAVAVVSGSAARGGTVLGSWHPATAAALDTPPATDVSPPAGPDFGTAPLLAAGPAGVVAYHGSAVSVSADGGRSWRDFPGPGGGSPIVVDSADLSEAISGGGAVRVTTDAGHTWSAPRSNPPSPGPWRPLLVSPFDAGVWFLIHQGRLLRTRDAAISWRDLPELPPLSPGAGMVPGAAPGQFVLFDGGRLFELDDNGQTVKPLPSLPAGASVVSLSVSGGTPAAARSADSAVYLQVGRGWQPAGAGLTGPVATGVNGMVLIGDGQQSAAHPGEVAVSSDSGHTWRFGTGLSADERVEALVALDGIARSLLVYCSGGRLFASSDSGATWSPVA